MRRVVVTGLAWSRRSAAASRRAGATSSPARAAPSAITDFEVDDLACQIACQCRAAKADGKFNPDEWMEPKEQRKVDDFIVYAMAAADQALDDAGWQPETRRGPDRTGVLIGSGIGGLRRHRRRRDHAARRGPAPHQPVLHSRPADQSRLRPGLDPPRLQGPEPCRGHGLLDRRACHRRRGAADRARRRRRDGRRRHRIAGLPAVARRLCRLPGAVDRLQRPPDRGLASL